MYVKNKTFHHPIGLIALSDSDLNYLIGGMRDTECKVWRGVCAVASIGSMFGLVGALIFDPTALTCTADLVFDFTHC